MSRLRRQMSYSASLSTWFVTSVCSRRECTHSTVLYGSTHAEEICGHDHTVKEIFDFLTPETRSTRRCDCEVDVSFVKFRISILSAGC